MALFVEGIEVGLILCFLLGPIFFTLVQTGVEQGFRAGAAVGLGIWSGDLLYMMACFWGVKQMESLTQWEHFYLVFGGLGSLILLLFGLFTLFSRPPTFTEDASMTKRRSSYLTLLIKGFLINGFNPFTIFFWLGVMTTYVIAEQLTGRAAFTFFSGIISIVITTDLLKIVLAKKIRTFLKPKHLLRIRQITGVALIIFSIVLVVKILFPT